MGSVGQHSDRAWGGGTASPQLDIFKPGGTSHLKAHSLT